MKLKQLYKEINNRYPFIGNVIRRVYNKKFLNSIRRSIRGGNNKITHRYAMLSSVHFDINGNNNHIEIQKECVLNNVKFHIRGDNHKIIISKGCRFNRGGVIWFEDNNGTLVIGEDSTFEDVHLAVTEPHSKINIGSNCMFAYDIDVRTGDSHSILSQQTRERINYAKDVIISDHVWVAAHSIILKGSFISENSVVAIGSVVTRCYEKKGIIIGGNPSRQLKEGITWSRNRNI